MILNFEKLHVMKPKQNDNFLPLVHFILGGIKYVHDDSNIKICIQDFKII